MLHKQFRLRLFSVLFLIGLLTLTACGDSSPTATNPASEAKPTLTVAATSKASEGTVAPVSRPSGGTPNLIRIYSSVPSADNVLDNVAKGSKMALADFTGGTGKIGDFTIELKIVDDGDTNGRWDGQKEKANATEAANDPDVMFYLGPNNSGAAQVSIPILNQAHVAMLSAGTSYAGLTQAVPGLTRAGEPEVYYPLKPRNFFRIWATDNLEGPTTVAFFKKSAFQKVFIIDDSQTFGKGLGNAVQQSCATEGLDCKRRTSITGTEQDYKALAEGIKNAAPDAVYYAGIGDAIVEKLFNDIRGTGLTIPFVGSSGVFKAPGFAKLGDKAGAVYGITPGLSAELMTEKGKDFVRRAKATYGNELTVGWYDATLVALTAIKNAGRKDRLAIIEAMTNLKDFETSAGKLSFDANGDTTLTDHTVITLKDGNWQILMSIKPSGASTGAK